VNAALAVRIDEGTGSAIGSDAANPTPVSGLALGEPA
jgi:hypothetical protein